MLWVNHSADTLLFVLIAFNFMFVIVCDVLLNNVECASVTTIFVEKVFHSI